MTLDVAANELESAFAALRARPSLRARLALTWASRAYALAWRQHFSVHPDSDDRMKA